LWAGGENFAVTQHKLRDAGAPASPAKLLAMNNDPRDLIAASPMSRAQWWVIAITVGLTALDGFDVLSISFASPGIAHEWGIDRAALGVVLSMELIGMAMGSILLGGIADRIGRRRMLLGCLVLMTLGMLMVAGVHGLRALCLWRVVTGLGIGGMLASNNAVATEFANVRRRDLCVAIMAIGYPLGAVIGGEIVAELLKSSDWRVVFELGAILTGVFLPIVYLWVPESVGWLCQAHPADAFERLNVSLRRLGYEPVDALPTKSARTAKGALVELFREGLASRTIILSITYFLHVTTFYFIVKWVPKIVVDMGFAPSSAAEVLVWTNVGGATGGAVLGLLAQRFNLRHLITLVFIGSTLMVALFGRGTPDLLQLSLVCALAGFCTNAGIVGAYALVARAFPTTLRASGTGFVIGVGRGGSVLAPIIAGFLFQAGLSLQAVAWIMGSGSLLAAVCLALLPARASAPHGTTVAANG
jgi:benzoate transport